MKPIITLILSIMTIFATQNDGAFSQKKAIKKQLLPQYSVNDVVEQMQNHFIYEDFVGLNKIYNTYRLKKIQIGEIGFAGLNQHSFASNIIKSNSLYFKAATFTSQEATGIRLQIDISSLEPDDKMWIFDAENLHSFGPYTAKDYKNKFWGPLVLGDTSIIIIESADESFGQFQIEKYAHVVKAFAADIAKACNKDLNCQNDTIKNIATGVAAFTFITGPYIGGCTGALVNTQSSSFIPYFLTAGHCTSNSTEASTMEIYWDYRSTSCDSGVAVDMNNTALVPRTDGATLLISHVNPDVSFLQLPDDGGGRWYAGWTATSPTLGDAVYCIHHPQGEYQRFSDGTIGELDYTIFCNNTNWTQQIKADWNASLTESGSSGSPLYNSEGKIIGDESGCGPWSCLNNAAGNWDTYASFESYYDSIKSYLEDGTPGSPALRHTIPWVVNNSQWSSTIAIYNNGASSANVTLRGLNTSGVEDTTTVSIPAMTLYTIESANLFASMSGYGLFIHSTSTDLMPSFITFNKNATSGASPSQSTSAKQSDLTNGILYGYLNAQAGAFPALVLIAPGNTGSLIVNMTLYDTNNGQIATDSITLTDERPFAAVLGSGLFDSATIPDHVSVRATTSNGKTITGATFYFNAQLEPSMSAPFILPAD